MAKIKIWQVKNHAKMKTTRTQALLVGSGIYGEPVSFSMHCIILKILCISMCQNMCACVFTKILKENKTANIVLFQVAITSKGHK